MEYLTVPFEIKENGITADGIIRGMASPFGGPPDDGGDVVVKGAFAKTIQKGGRNGTGVAMLAQHGRVDKTPIGNWTKLVEVERGLDVEGEMFIGDPSKLEGTTLANDTYVSARRGGLKGLSIGWDFPRDKSGMRIPESFEIDREKGVRFLKEIDLWEISLVTFPMARRSQITNVKDIEHITTARELEDYLRESKKFSKAAAQVIVKLARPSLRESKQEPNGDEALFKVLNETINNLNNKLKGLKNGH